MADQFGFTAEKALEMAMLTLGSHLANPQRGPQAAALLGPLWEDALRRVRIENFGIIKSGPKIDVDRLQRSDRTKSGFEGVYINGQGFRAIGRVPNSSTQKHLGVFESAEEAAWSRFMYYQEQNLPYGDWEVIVDQWRSGNKSMAPFEGSDADLIEAIKRHNIEMGLGHFNASAPQNPNTAAPTPRARRNGEADMAQTIAELRAANDARDDAFRAQAQERIVAQTTPKQCVWLAVAILDCSYCQGDLCMTHPDDACECNTEQRHAGVPDPASAA